MFDVACLVHDVVKKDCSLRGIVCTGMAVALVSGKQEFSCCKNSE